MLRQQWYYVLRKTSMAPIDILLYMIHAHNIAHNAVACGPIIYKLSTGLSTCVKKVEKIFAYINIHGILKYTQ